MAKQIIRLNYDAWDFDDTNQIGKAGGFGEVFCGTGEIGQVAIKRLKITANQAAHRELDIANELMSRSLSFVVPIYDLGQDAESERYFIVMPLCDYNLQNRLDELQDNIDLSFASEVINCVLKGLKEVQDITHRDLKPDNILFHEGVWKIADFGISKFVEDSTSVETMRNFLTPQYAAPEQWKGEKPTNATDVYALGCIVHRLFTGHPPFTGTKEDLRHSHLFETPSSIENLPSRFSAFATQMLRKSPKARPSLDRCQIVFQELINSEQSFFSSHSSFLEAAKKISNQEAESESLRIRNENKRREREELYKDAKEELNRIKNDLFHTMHGLSENAKLNSGSGIFEFGLARCKFYIHSDYLPEMKSEYHDYQRKPLWDKVGWGKITVDCIISENKTKYSWAATLLYLNQDDGNGYRWYEIGFWAMNHKYGDEPFALEGFNPDLDIALSNVMGVVNIAYGPFPIDGENETDFIERWLGIIATAAIGELTRPNGMPIRAFPK